MKCNKVKHMHKRDVFRGEGGDRQHIGFTKDPAKSGYKASEHEDWKLSDIQELPVHVFNASGPEDGDFPPQFRCSTLPADAQPGIGAETVNLEFRIADVVSSRNTPGMHMTDTSSAVPAALASGVGCTAQASSSNTPLIDNSTITPGKFANATEPNLMVWPSRSFNSNRCNSLPLSSIDPVTSCIDVESLTTPSPRNLLMTSTLCPSSSSDNNYGVAQSHVGTYPRFQGQEVKPRNSQVFTEATETQGEGTVAVEEPLQFPKRTQTKSTLSETNLRASKIIGGSTTLVVRNLPIGCTKELLLQMWPPDGTYDYPYLPFSFNQSRSAAMCLRIAQAMQQRLLFTSVGTDSFSLAQALRPN